MRLIDADQDVSHYIETWDCHDCNGNGRQRVMAVDDLQYLPAIDAVPVVRCRDCKYYLRTDDGLPYCTCEDGGVADYPTPEDYCSYGRRADE